MCVCMYVYSSQVSGIFTFVIDPIFMSQHPESYIWHIIGA